MLMRDKYKINRNGWANVIRIEKERRNEFKKLPVDKKVEIVSKKIIGKIIRLLKISMHNQTSKEYLTYEDMNINRKLYHLCVIAGVDSIMECGLCDDFAVIVKDEAENFLLALKLEKEDTVDYMKENIKNYIEPFIKNFEKKDEIEVRLASSGIYKNAIRGFIKKDNFINDLLKYGTVNVTMEFKNYQKEGHLMLRNMSIVKMCR